MVCTPLPLPHMHPSQFGPAPWTSCVGCSAAWPASGPLGTSLTVGQGPRHMLLYLRGSAPPFLVNFYSPFWSLFKFLWDGIFCDMPSQNQVFFLQPIVSLMGLCNPCLRLPLDYQLICVPQSGWCLELQTIKKYLLTNESLIVLLLNATELLPIRSYDNSRR